METTMKHSSSCDNFCKAFFVLALTWRLLSACDGWLITPRAGTISVPHRFLYLYGASFIMNRTLFDCGIQKKVELRSGDLYDVTEILPKAVKLKYDSVRCSICSQSFFGKQYLDQHMRFKHPSECNGQESTDQSITLQSSSSPSNDVQEIEERQDDSLRTANKIPKRRRGSATHKSYTVEFKKKTLDLLDSLSNSRNKWKKVAEVKQISKRLVI